MTGVFLNDDALRNLGRRALVTIVEHRGEIPTGHEVETDMALLHDAGRARVDFLLHGAKLAAELMAPSIEAKALAAYQRVIEAEAATTQEAIGELTADRDAWKERALEAERTNARYLVSEKVAVWGAGILLGVACMVAVAVAGFAFVGRLGR